MRQKGLCFNSFVAKTGLRAGDWGLIYSKIGAWLGETGPLIAVFAPPWLFAPALTRPVIKRDLPPP